MGLVHLSPGQGLRRLKCRGSAEVGAEDGLVQLKLKLKLRKIKCRGSAEAGAEDAPVEGLG
jgi:hypothetical protein